LLLFTQGKETNFVFNQRANLCSEHTSPFSRLPLLTLSYNIIGFKPWRPAAVSGTVLHKGKVVK